MSGAPQFPIPSWVGAQPLRPGGAAHKAGPTLEQRIEALERGALGRPGPGVVDGCTITSDTSQQGGAAWSDRHTPFYAGLYLTTGGTPTHTSKGGWQNVADGGGTDAWTAICDIRPTGVAAQVDTSAGAGTITVRRAGIYLVCYKVAFASMSVAGKLVGAAVAVDGVLALATTYVTAAASESPILGSSEHISLDSGDVLDLQAFQDDSASEAYYAGVAGTTRLSIQYLGPAS